MFTLGWTEDSGVELFNLDWLEGVGPIDLPDELTGTFTMTFGDTFSETMGNTFYGTFE